MGLKTNHQTAAGSVTPEMAGAEELLRQLQPPRPASDRARQSVPADPVMSAEAHQLLYWLLGMLAGLPDDALRGLGLSESKARYIRERHAEDIHCMGVLRLMARQMSRGRMAELLRARLSGLALTAGTASELAAIARTARAMPDWVWDDAVLDGDGTPAGRACRHGLVPAFLMPRPAQPEATAADNAGDIAHDLAATAGRSMEAETAPRPSVGAAGSSAGFAGAPPLNRQQRRAAESRLRKAAQ